jgi:hypothetical protein
VTPGRWVWALLPYVGLAFFVWRQQGLEARLAEWVATANASIQKGLDGLAAASADAFDDDAEPLVPPADWVKRAGPE